jgi:hypothetical protein
VITSSLRPTKRKKPSPSAAAGHRDERKAVALAWPLDGAHHLERSRWQKRMRDAVAGHEIECSLAVELFEAACEHRHTVMPSWLQHVEQPADPGPIGRCPHEPRVLGKERLRHLDARQVPEQHAVAVERALRLACRSRRVNNDRRVVGRCIDRHERGRLRTQLRPKWKRVEAGGSACGFLL